MRNELKVGLMLALWLIPFGGGFQGLGGSAYAKPTDKQTAVQSARHNARVPNSPDQPVPESKLTADQIVALANSFYATHSPRTASDFPNANLARMHRLATTYDQISRARFSGGAPPLASQREAPELIDYVLKGGWLDEMSRMTGDPIYAYSEDRALRIFISSHAAAQSYSIPYPTLFCLLFQESQFNFKVRSSSGATGLGQLTGVAVKQIQINRKTEEVERRLQSALTNIRTVYSDPVMLEVLKKMGFQPGFPVLGKFPKDIQTSPAIDDAFVAEMQRELTKDGHSYGGNLPLVKKLSRQISRGILLPKQYAAMHPVYLRVVSQAKATLGNTLHVETNVLLSALLLRYYMDFPWKVDHTVVKLQPEVKAMVAVAAYNQGPAGVLRYLAQFKRAFPEKDLGTMNLNDFRATFTSARVASALRRTPAQTREIVEHVWKVKLCAHDGISRTTSE